MQSVYISQNYRNRKTTLSYGRMGIVSSLSAHTRGWRNGGICPISCPVLYCSSDSDFRRYILLACYPMRSSSLSSPIQIGFIIYSLLIITTMSESQDYARHGRPSRPFENRENKEPESRSSYLRHFHQKGKQQKHQIQMMFKEADSNIQNILNNSMSHLQKVIQGMEAPTEHLSFNDILHQNALLKESLAKMRKILKEKLQAGLNKQREELAKVLGDYTCLIAKLLDDKQELTNALKQTESHRSRQSQHLKKIEILKQQNHKLKEALKERDQQIKQDSQKLDQFLAAIHQYEEDDHKERQRVEAMMLRIQELQSKAKSKEHLLSSSFSDKRESHGAKVQTLIELLQKAEQENSRLNQEIKNLRRSKQQLRESYEERIAEINHQNQEEFAQYEKAVKETLDKKDDCIERLNMMVESLKRK